MTDPDFELIPPAEDIITLSENEKEWILFLRLIHNNNVPKVTFRIVSLFQFILRAGKITF